jgi:hypothetical protein
MPADSGLGRGRGALHRSRRFGRAKLTLPARFRGFASRHAICQLSVDSVPRLRILVHLWRMSHRQFHDEPSAFLPWVRTARFLLLPVLSDVPTPDKPTDRTSFSFVRPYHPVRGESPVAPAPPHVARRNPSPSSRPPTRRRKSIGSCNPERGQTWRYSRDRSFGYLRPNKASSAQKPRKCGPREWQCPSRSGSAQPTRRKTSSTRRKSPKRWWS